MINREEKYIVSWLYPNRMRDVGSETATYDEAVRLIDGFKCIDKYYGKKYKYRIVKQTILEEVVYDEL